MVDKGTGVVVDAADRMFGLLGFRVLAAGEVGGELEVLAETVEEEAGCPSCGVVATGHGRRAVSARDVTMAGRPVLLVWSKRLWRCGEQACAKRTWSEESGQVRARSTLTERARRWAFEQVGRQGRTVASVARDLGVGWATVMDAVREYGRPRVEEAARSDRVRVLGVDEHAWLRGNSARRTDFVTGIVDLAPGAGGPARLLDVVRGRSGKVLTDWLDTQDASWREGITAAALDPFRAYANALSTALPAATLVLDAFHVVKLANTAVDEVRRRVQHATCGHRGRKNDPLYRVRRLLCRGQEKLTPAHREKLRLAFDTGDPDGEVQAAWEAAGKVRELFTAPTPAHGLALLLGLLAELPTHPVPEIARLGKTLRAWQTELRGYFTTGGVSNGPTEALNLVIEKVRRNAHGFRNFDNYRLRLLLHCGITWDTLLTPRIRSRQPRLVA